MKKLIAFFKQNSSLITKFWLYQVVWSVVGLMVSWSVSIMLNENPNYSLYMGLLGVFTAGIFLFQIYDLFNQLGLKYSIRKNNPNDSNEGIPTDSFGLKVTVFASVPTAILVLLYSIFYFVNIADGVVVMKAIIFMLPIHSMYNAAYLAIGSELIRVLFTILSLCPAILFGWMGYYLGVRDKGVVAREKVSKE